MASTRSDALPRYPRREENLCCILTRNKPAAFNDPESFPLMPFDFSKQIESIVIRIHSWRDDGMFLEFDVYNVEPCIVNSLRRVLLSEVPSLAPETVLMRQNTTILSDDMIGNRVGLVPFKGDPRRFKFRPVGNKTEHPDYGMMFGLDVAAQKVPRGPSKATVHPIVTLVDVYSSHLKLLPHSEHPADLIDERVGPVHGDILLARLHPAQELEFRVFVVKGIGKDHAKFSPVSTAFYRAKPEIRLLREIVGEKSYQLQNYFGKGVVEVVKNQSGMDTAVVAEDRLYTGNRKVLTDAVLNDAVQIGFRKNEFIFEVESVGALQSVVLVKEAFSILKNHCEYHLLRLARFRPPIPSVVKMEE